jgi:hypothetical protein
MSSGTLLGTSPNKEGTVVTLEQGSQVFKEQLHNSHSHTAFELYWESLAIMSLEKEIRHSFPGKTSSNRRYLTFTYTVENLLTS